jgi:alpha-beta hydrolase superfamily lysophospholipase
MRHPAHYVLPPLLLVALSSCVAIAPVETIDPGTEIEAASRTPALAASDRSSLASDRFIAADGVALPLRAWLPEGRPSAVVLALHGLNDYSNAFALPAPGFLAQGIAVYAFDQRGFGAAPPRGRWAGDRTMVADAILATRLLRERYPDIPLYLLGESMGGAIAVLAVTGPAPAPVDGVILAAPAVWGRQTMNIFERVGWWVITQLPALEFTQRSVPYKIHPSDNIPMLRALGADPLVLKEARTDTLAGVVDLMSAAVARAPYLAVPALILYGEKDEIVPRDAVASFVDHLPADAQRRQRIALYPNGYHMLLRDLQGATVLADVAAWVHDPRAGLPSGADSGGRALLTGRGESFARLD